MTLKVLHTADWHLGRAFPSFDRADAETLSRARFEVVERIFGLAKRHQVDAVLCAGDLFDEPRPDRAWYHRLAQILKTHGTGVPVVLLPGNHDPLVPGSVWHPDHEMRRLLPPFAHVVDRGDFELALGDHAVVLARPCTSKSGQRDNALALPDRAPGDERIRIGMAHGSSFDERGWETNFPIAKDAAIRRGLDYLAIGDTHTFREVPPDAEVPTVYPSAPEATNFGEKGTGFVASVFFKRHGRRAIVRKERVARWRWRHERITSIEALRTLASEELAHTVLRLELAMTANAAEHDEVDAIVLALKGNEAAHGRAGVLQLQLAEMELRTDDIERYFEGLPDVLRATASKLRELEQGEFPTRARRALYHLYRLTRGLGDGARDADAPGHDAPGHDAPGHDAPGHDAPATESNGSESDA